MKKATIFLFLAGILFSCNNSGNKTDKSTGTDKLQNTNTTTASDNANTPASQVLNGIELEPRGGLKVQRAFLSFESGDLLPDNNQVLYGQQVKLNLNLDGWEATDGKVMLGASEKITAADGTVLLDNADMFADNTSGLSEQDAHFITFSATVEKTATPSPYYLVSFNVWNKKGSGAVKGSYKLYMQ